MSGIVKRKKSSDYAQIHNNPLQNLKDIRSIGLMAHLMSLPETWEIRKMQLYNKFGRAAISHGISELEEEKFWIDIKFRNGKQNDHIYHLSDVPFNEQEVYESMQEVVDSGYKVMEVSLPFMHLLPSIDEYQQLKNKEPSIDDSQQLKINCSNSIVEKEHLLKEIDLQTNTNKKNISKRNTTSSSSYDKSLIDNELKKLYPNAPFEAIKEQVLNDPTLIVKTEKQYRSILKFRLDNWKPGTSKKSNKPVRKEAVPAWLQEQKEKEANSAEESVNASNDMFMEAYNSLTQEELAEVMSHVKGKTVDEVKNAIIAHSIKKKFDDRFGKSEKD